MNLSYNAAVTLVCEALNWSIEKARHILMTDMHIKAPADRDAPGLVSATSLGRFIYNNYLDRNNRSEY